MRVQINECSSLWAYIMFNTRICSKSAQRQSPSQLSHICNRATLLNIDSFPSVIDIAVSRHMYLIPQRRKASNGSGALEISFGWRQGSQWAAPRLKHGGALANLEARRLFHPAGELLPLV